MSSVQRQAAPECAPVYSARLPFRFEPSAKWQVITRGRGEGLTGAARGGLVCILSSRGYRFAHRHVHYKIAHPIFVSQNLHVCTCTH